MLGAGVGLGLIPRDGMGVHPMMESLVPVLEDELGCSRVLRFFAPVQPRHSRASVLVEALDRLADMLSQLRSDA